ncbi:MAG: hypothetical protein IT538_01955 [Variibacter sp.]|nr:hypothetical protein [Variibacter sp.]
MNVRFVIPAMVAALAAAGCATVPTGPNIMVLPGPTKNFEQFQADQAGCQQYAFAAIGGQSAQQNAADAAVGSAAAATILGAAAGAIIGAATGNAGAGAAWGAGTGLLWGSAAGANAAGWSYAESQRRFDMAYAQCMFARGHQLPGRVAYRAPAGPAAPAYPPPNQPPPNLSGGGSVPRTAAPRAAPPAPSAAPSGYGMPPGPIAPGPAMPVTPPGNYPPSSYPPPNTPAPPGVAQSL